MYLMLYLATTLTVKGASQFSRYDKVYKSKKKICKLKLVKCELNSH